MSNCAAVRRSKVGGVVLVGGEEVTILAVVFSVPVQYTLCSLQFSA